MLKTILRKLGLMYVADEARYYIHLFKTRKERKLFFEQHKDEVLPPPHYIYETFKLDYSHYFYGGKETAEWIVSFIRKYVENAQPIILDWGCGPARIVRHLPTLLPEATIWGSDYNSDYVNWCSQNLKGIQFVQNGLEPPVPLKDSSMDFIYGISIFTHLSEQLHYAWRDELLRMLKPGGVLFLTFQGDVFVKKLTEQERAIYNKGELIVRGNTKEGHRTYCAFHPEKFVRELFSGCEILEWIKGEGTEQDVWIIRKK